MAGDDPDFDDEGRLRSWQLRRPTSEISDYEVIRADDSEPRLAFGQGPHTLLERKIATINGHPSVRTVDVRLARLIQAEVAKVLVELTSSPHNHVGRSEILSRVEPLRNWRAVDGDVFEFARALVRALDGVDQPTSLARYNPEHNHNASGVYANCPGCGTMSSV